MNFFQSEKTSVQVSAITKLIVFLTRKNIVMEERARVELTLDDILAKMCFQEEYTN